MESVVPVSEVFRLRVTRVLSEADPSVRQGMRGQYLFTIDGRPSFVVELAVTHASSGKIPADTSVTPEKQVFGQRNSSLSLQACDGGICPFSKPLSLLELSESARVHVSTDSVTLERLLTGTMKAKKAFLSGKVKIDGDLPIFLRLVGFLKEQGVAAPVGNFEGRPQFSS